MSRKLNRISIGKLAPVYYDILALDYQTNQIIFASIIDKAKEIKKIKYEINRSNNVYCSEDSCYYNTKGEKYNIISKRMPKSDFSHLILNKKDCIEELNESSNELLTSYIYLNDLNDKDAINNVLYDKLYDKTSIPIIKEWMGYIIEELLKREFLNEITVYSCYETAPFKCYRLRISTNQLLEIVQNGIRGKKISINGSYENSPMMEITEGLDSYLNLFGDILASKIQQSFIPKFIPGEDDFSEYVNNYDDSCFHNDIELYKAQKNAIQACVNNLQKSNVAFVIAEMGTGKTAMGAGIAYADYGQKAGLTASVICPSHLVEKWKREIERLVPNGKAYIIKDIDDLLSLEYKIKNKNKRENMFIIISKETAKNSYEKRPAAIWSQLNHTFVCPECGQPLYKLEKRGRRDFQKINFDEKDMMKQYAYNSTCMNKVTVFNRKTHKIEERECNCKLWVPLNKEDENTKWIKLGKEGWLQKDYVNRLVQRLDNKEKLTKKETSLFVKALEAKEALEEGEPNRGLKAPRKYSIAKYIRERFKGDFDYAIVDEMHLFKGRSQQGEAMADITKAAKKFIGLTGTLLNGYADGLFYILYRTCPDLMVKEGYDYNSELQFMRDYGVMKETTKYSSNSHIKIGPTVEKRLPGVSPIVFTKFLLENAVFLSLSDMDGGLPKYEEIPYGVEMDDELRSGYEQLDRDLRANCGWGSGSSGNRIMGSMVQALSVYPDMPYDQPDILNPDNDEVLVSPVQLPLGLRNKENELLKIVKEKVENDEKVLIYCNWTNKTDVQEKLDNLLKENNINSTILTSKVKADSREEWIEKQLEKGLQVLICNPSLVETGLDLLAFTNIIFYQLGYNLFTLRQASRRSWRLSQDKDIKVYFMYYKGTIQEKAISLMATKLQAAMALEGKFSEEGLRALSNNEDLLTQIANSVVEGIKNSVDTTTFVVERTERVHDTSRNRKDMAQLLVLPPLHYDFSFLDKPEVKQTAKMKNMEKCIKDNSLIFNAFKL